MSDTASQKPPRERPTKKACDLCRTRKVKCRMVQDGTACELCRDLQLNCTQNKPRRKRGPPNRHAQMQFRLLDHAEAPSTPLRDQPSPLSPLGPNLQPTTHGFLSNQLDQPTNPNAGTRCVYSIVSSIGSLELVHSILDDWFRYIHPLCPILHRQKLLQRLHDHGTEDLPAFGAMIIAICAATLSTLRRKSFEQYPTISAETCLRIIEEGKLLQSQPLTVDYCVTWYYIAVVVLVLQGPGNYRLYRAIREAMISVDWLLCHRRDEQSWQDQELLKRLYWFLYMWQVGVEIQGQPHLAFLPFNQNLDHLKPLDLSDRQLYPNLISQQATPDWHLEDCHFMPGFHSLIDVNLSWEQAKADLTHRSAAETLQSAFDRIQRTLDDLPPELRWRGRLTRHPKALWGHEVQMVNIMITALSLKSNYLQHLGPLVPGLTQHDIACDVLEILENLPQALFEANGYSVVLKVRDIGAAYLAELESSGAVQDSTAQEKVQLLLKTLDNLDYRPPTVLTQSSSVIDT